MCSWMAAVAVLGRRVRCTSVTTSRASGPVKTSSSKRPMVAASGTPNIWAAARLSVVMRPSASSETTPVVIASSTVSM